ncbi:MAG: hypothetical protein AMXMBFR33_61400 [Candidatus Xenobia bacterium]
MDKSYLFYGTSKRLQAANEALEQLAALPEYEPAARLVQTVAAEEKQDKLRVPLLREALARIGDSTASQAAASSSFLAAVALAALGPEAPPERAELACREVGRRSDDPMARALAGSNAGRAGLELLSTPRPSDPPALAAWATRATGLHTAARLALMRQVVGELSASGEKAACLLASLDGDYSMLQAGLLELSRPGASVLSMAATALPRVAPERRLKVEQEVLSSLPAEQQSWARSWLASGQSDREKGAILRAVATRTEPLAALRDVSQELGKLSPELARRAIDDLPKNAHYPGFAAWCQQKQLAPEQALATTLDLLEGKLDADQAISQAVGLRGDLAAEWLTGQATSESAEQGAFLASLAAMLDPSEPAEWALEASRTRPGSPAEAVKACGGRVDQLPPERLKAALAPLAQLAGTEDAELMRLATCDSEELRKAALTRLGQGKGAVFVGAGVLRSSNRPAEVGAALEEFLPGAWRDFCRPLARSSSDDSIRRLIHQFCLDQAASGKAFDATAGMPLVQSLLQRPVPDALGDAIFTTLREGATDRSRLDSWLQIARKLKLSGDQLARGAARLVADPKLTPGLVASDTVTSTRDPKSSLELMRWEAAGAQDPKQAAYLSAFVAVAESARGPYRDQTILSALARWKSLPQPASLHQALLQVKAAASSAGDSVQAARCLTRALPLLKPLVSQPNEESLLDFLIQHSQQPLSDPTAGSATLQRAVDYFDHFRQARGIPLAYLAGTLASGNQEDELHMQRQIFQAIKTEAGAQGNQANEEVAGFFLDLEQWLPPTEAGPALKAGLALLANQVGSLRSTVQQINWPGSASRVAAFAKWGEITAASAGAPALRHSGNMLRRMADLPLETVDLRANAMHYAFHQIDRRTDADPMLQLWLVGQAALGQAGGGSQQLRVARLTCEELKAMARGGGKQMEASYFEAMEKVLGMDLPSTNDRIYLAHAFLNQEPNRTPQDIARLGSFLTYVGNYLSDESATAVARKLFDELMVACKGWGDTRLMLPLLEKASSAIEQDGSRANIVKVGSQLAKDLASYQENYWIVVASQGGPRSEVQEKEDSVIVGSVRVAKNRE